MAIDYVLNKKKNPLDVNEPPKLYAQAEIKRTLTSKTISREISAVSTTVSDTDVMAVMNEYFKQAKKNLGNSYAIPLGDLGTLEISLSSESSENEEDFHYAKIKRAKVLYRPSSEMKEFLSTLKYQKVEKREKKKKKVTEEQG